jgi:hypothetical protein
MRRTFPVLLAAAFLLPVTTQAQQDTESSFSIDMAAGTAVEVSTITGSIEASEYEGSTLEVSYVVFCDDPAEMEALEVVHDTSDGIVFRVEYPDDWNGSSTAVVDFDVAVPASIDADLLLQTVDGDVILTGCGGSAEINTVTGRAEIAGFGGELEVNVVDGDIVLSGTPRVASANLVDGTIDGDIDVLECDLDVSAVGGRVILALPKGVHVSVATISGDISVPHGHVTQEIVGSTAEYGEGDLDVDVSTVSADVEISD